MERVQVEHLGLIDYQKCWDYQEELSQANIDIKLQQRKDDTFKGQTRHHLLFCEHPLVFTLGKSGKLDHLLSNEEELDEQGIQFYKINRGGDITHHGPGQLVAYPIFDLERFFTDIHKYLRFLEEAVILMLQELGITAGRYEGYTGVWLDADQPLKARKICAMGIRCSRWVTMHGLALNVNNDLSPFDQIVPCGIDDKKVTSIQRELGREVEMDWVRTRLLFHMANLFNFEHYQE